MQEVLDQLYMDHRNKLGIGRKHFGQKVNKGKSVVKNDQRNIIYNYYGRSLELTDKKRDKAMKERKQTIENAKFLSRQERNVMRKYMQGYDDQQVKLPKIKNTITSTSSRMQANSQKTIHSFQSQRKRTTKQIFRRVNSFEIDQKSMKKLRKCFNAVLFVVRLKRRLKQHIHHFNKTLKLSNNLLKIIDKQVNKYYGECLREPLLNYQVILEKKLATKDYNPFQDIVQNILQFSQKIAKTSIRRDILDFLTLISMNNAFIPIDYFCQFQLLRLDFHSSNQQIGRVSQEQVQMIVGMFVGIRILCMYIFFQPWNVQLFSLNIRKIEKKIRSILFAYGSFFYWCLLQLFDELPANNYKYLEKLIKRGWKPMSLQEQSNEFFEGFKKSYKKKYFLVKRNLKQWIQKISLAVVKNRQIYLN